jgi:NTP pyrophosphatase (non-canonical NTP hydrolase)
MGYLTDGLTFNTLRAANTRRLPTFKNAQGDPAHSEPDGSDWALSAWCNAVLGELGEAANLIKKIERGDFTLEMTREALAKEFADVVTYLDLLAFRAGVDLGRATIDKFNEVSRRVGSPVRIREDGSDYAITPLDVAAHTDAGQHGRGGRVGIPGYGDHA